jgi:hypothetical protein
MMQVFEKILDPEKANHIESCLLNLPWYYETSTSDFTEIPDFQRNVPNVLETPYMVNMLGCHSHGTSANDIKPFISIIHKLEEATGRSFLKRIQRIKANLYLKRVDYPDNYYQLPHVDMWNANTNTPDPGEIFLYYGDDSDGDTFFFIEEFGSSKYTEFKRSSPKRGKGILFDNSFVHASSPPRFHERRMTLNFVFTK